jgi:hypothetical protein
LIIKELDSFASSDKFQMAGRKAEEQMAHYLRRFFGSSADVDVLNYLRIELGGEVAQMDHLVLHPYGLLIVESKSVSGSVQIKDDGQWIRWFAKQPQGMRSPVTQAKMQLMLLKELLDKTVRQKGFFDQVAMDVVVAISDSGTIQWPVAGIIAEVCKADQVPERILGRVEQFGSARPRILSSEHRRVIADFLCKVHKPLARESVAPNASIPAPTSPAPSSAAGDSRATAKGGGALPEKVCKYCRSAKCEVRHGQFGYYLACGECSKNTRLRFACPKCGGDGRIRKQGREFFAECRACDASVLFHTSES